MRRRVGGGRPPGSMARRLGVGLALFVVLTLVAGVVIGVGVVRRRAATSDLTGRLLPLAVANSRARADFADAQAALRAAVITREGRFVATYRSSQRDLTQTLSRERRLASAALLRQVSAERRSAAAWFGYARRMEGLAPASPALKRLTDQAYSSSEDFHQASTRLQARLRTLTQTRTAESQGALNAAVAWSAVLAGVAVTLALLAALATIRALTRPLGQLSTTLRRLAAGEHAARADVRGPAEVREVASSVNVLADESDRLRRQASESARLRAGARAAGFRIREHLRTDEVITEARAALEENVDADVVYLHVMREGDIGRPVGHREDWVMSDAFLNTVRGEEFSQIMTAVLRDQSSLVIQNLQGPEGDQVPPQFRDPLRAAGVVSGLITPFGVGGELYGVVAADRLQHGRPFTPAEVDAVESIAADLGRGLRHARLYEAENRLVAELRAVDQAKSDFLGTVSHELRTPLTSIAGYVELLRDEEAGPLSDGQARMLETVDRNTARLRSLIEDLLTLSKIESGAFKTALRPVVVQDVVAGAVEALQPSADSKQIVLAWAGPDRAVRVRGDAEQLDRVLMNLLSNAVKFTPAGGRVHVQVGVEEGNAVTSVSDTGMGIPEADLQNLFRRFFRASNAVHRSVPGTGLGLTLARTIVANHSGEIDVASQEGEGTTFTVRIPLLSGASPEPAPDPRAGETPAPADPGPQGPGPERSGPGEA